MTPTDLLRAAEICLAEDQSWFDQHPWQITDMSSAEQVLVTACSPKAIIALVKRLMAAEEAFSRQMRAEVAKLLADCKSALIYHDILGRSMSNKHLIARIDSALHPQRSRRKTRGK